MNLDLTKREYLALLKAVYLADCVANFQGESHGEENLAISRLRRKIFSLANEAGFGELVRHDAARDDYVESDILADEMDTDFMERHVDAVFSRELVGSFTDKIMDERFGAEMTGWSDAKYKKQRARVEAKVEAEIQANGLKNVILLGDFS